MKIVEGGNENIKKNISKFDRALTRIESELNLSENSPYSSMTVREQKELKQISKDLVDCAKAVSVVVARKKNIDTDAYRFNQRVKELIEECAKIVEFFDKHPIHDVH